MHSLFYLFIWFIFWSYKYNVYFLPNFVLFLEYVIVSVETRKKLAERDFKKRRKKNDQKFFWIITLLYIAQYTRFVPRGDQLRNNAKCIVYFIYLYDLFSGAIIFWPIICHMTYWTKYRIFKTRRIRHFRPNSTDCRHFTIFLTKKFFEFFRFSLRAFCVEWEKKFEKP